RRRHTRSKRDWSSDVCSSDLQIGFLSELPTTITVSVDGLGDILFCHATPSSDEDIFTPLTSQEQVTDIFSDVQQKTVICGHTHMQFERRVGDTRIFNPSRVGMPFADEPGEYWLLCNPEGVASRLHI